jgi:mono/diheme cytochrome c family protein
MRLIPCAVSLFVKGLFLAAFAWSLWFTSASASMVGMQPSTSPIVQGIRGKTIQRPALQSFADVELLAPPAEPKAPRSASTLYAKYCARCHQADGSGNRNRSTEVPDFTRPAWQRERSDIQLLISIRDGMGRAMPGFGDRMSEKELEELAAYVRKFAPSKSVERPRTQNADFDARFHKLELELAELRREFWDLHTGSDQK